MTSTRGRDGARAMGAVGIVAGAVFMALLRMAQISLGAQARGVPFDPETQMRIEASFWGAWVLEGLVVYAASWRVDLRREPRRAVVIMAALVVFALLTQPLLDALGSAALQLTTWGTLGATLQRKLLFNSLNNLQIAVATVGVLFALRLYARYRERDRMARLLQDKLAAARLTVLRTQLDPHFLFNSLNAVAMLARKGATDEVVQMISGLSDFLRDTLDESRPHLIPLSRELEFVGRYLSIEQVRFGKRLRVHIDAGPETLDVRVPSFILLPVVENAVRHGVSVDAGAVVEITSGLENGSLVVRVRDRGAGVDAAVVTTGIGLRNSRARLEELYGELGVLHLESHPDGGAIVTLRVPADRTATQVYAAAT